MAIKESYVNAGIEAARKMLEQASQEINTLEGDFRVPGKFTEREVALFMAGDVHRAIECLDNAKKALAHILKDVNQFLAETDKK